MWENNDGCTEVLHLKQKRINEVISISVQISHFKMICSNSTLNMVLASSGRDTLCIRIAKLNVFVRKMGLSTGSTGLSLIWNNVAVWSKPK